MVVAVPAPSAPGISPEDKCAQLARVLGSSDFKATARERNFLGYVVAEELAGRGCRIKAYSIAVEVFGRDASFDPQNDPIVRIEAGHLRRALERYYLTSGQNDPILIRIPKGGYVPTFGWREVSESPAVPSEIPDIEPTAPAASPKRRTGRVLAVVAAAAFLAALAVLAPRFLLPDGGASAPETPRLLVEEFEDLSEAGTAGTVATGLTQEVITQLSKFRDIVVVEARGTPAEEQGQSARYALSGSLASTPERFRLRVRLVNRSDGSVLWANSYDGAMNVATLMQAQADIAESVATNLAQSYGVIFTADAALNVADPPADWAAYSCTLAYYAYRTSLDRAALPGVRDCLERAVERFPGYATAWGLLAQVDIDGVRFNFPHDPVASRAAIDRALTTARRAIELDPRNIRGLQAEMFGLSLNGEYDAARRVGEAALAINPNDTELMGEFGYRLALSGDWDKGCRLLSQARERISGPSAYYETALALCAYFKGDNTASVMWIRKTTAPSNPLYHLIAAAVYGEAGRLEDARASVKWLVENEPALASNARREVATRLRRSQDVEFAVGSLIKAGLDIPAEGSVLESGL